MSFWLFDPRIKLINLRYKNALQQFLLNGRTKLSSLTLLYYFAPACALINGIFILIFELKGLQRRGSSGIGVEVFLANGVLCFALNIASVTVVSIHRVYHQTPFD